MNLPANALPAVRLPIAHATTPADYARIREHAARIRQIARQAEAERRALVALRDVVRDLITEPDCPPQLRAAYVAYREEARA